MLGDRFKKAREFLGSSRNSIAKKLGLSNQSIGRIETNEIQNPNWHYVEFLIKQGINPYFLIGESDEIHVQKTADLISKKEYDRILQQLKEIESEKKELKTKYETMQEAFKLINTHQ